MTWREDCAINDELAGESAPPDTSAFLWVYGTGQRPDGYRFAVGESAPDAFGHTVSNGSLALFQDAGDAQLFAYARQNRDGCMVHVMPSAEVD